ncbi:thiamine phosphate synthase [Candidatus Pelagibacter sp. Uisw_090]|uniref:thiamine phosphate synthase n=1 Tax=Candidatus Pelagibacter sp. Uisw_090 TaxID=3230993 RepID=UPI0039EC5ED2
MHFKNLKFFCFIDKFDNNIINKLLNNTSVIYRNYHTKNNLDTIISIKNACKKKGIKFYLSNDVKLAIKLNLDGAYVPSFNKDRIFNSYNFKKKFKLLGSAHNLQEIKEKEIQNVNYIFLSPLFTSKKNKNCLGLYRFLNLMKKTKKKIICLGGVNEKNLSQIKILNPYGIASISLFQNESVII